MPRCPQCKLHCLQMSLFCRRWWLRPWSSCFERPLETSRYVVRSGWNLCGFRSFHHFTCLQRLTQIMPSGREMKTDPRLPFRPDIEPRLRQPSPISLRSIIFFALPLGLSVRKSRCCMRRDRLRSYPNQGSRVDSGRMTRTL